MSDKREGRTVDRNRVPLLALLMALLALTAALGCSSLTPEPTHTLTATSTLTQTCTSTPVPLPTSTPTSTPLPTTTPTPTGTPTPTPIVTWLTDPQNDVGLAHIDVAGLGYEISGETLRVTLLVRDVPDKLSFNRVGVPENRLEYEWAAYVDVDNNPATGSSGLPALVGADYSIGARYFVNDPGVTITKAISQVVQVDVTRLEGQSFSWVTMATLQVDPEAETLVLIGEIPGLTSESRVFFYTYDYNPGGLSISDS
jgi:hypothetical protein